MLHRYRVPVLFEIVTTDQEAAHGLIDRALDMRWHGAKECKQDGFESWEIFPDDVEEMD